MRTIRTITEEELDRFVTLSINAYPGMEIVNQSDRSRFRERLQQANENPNIHLFALFEEEEMRGVMHLYDFTMKFLSTKTVVGGVGGVAVDLLHKKEKIAADMLRAYLRHYRDKGACLAALYPFRPDFYKRMGFGYGTKMNSYRFRPGSLPKGPTKHNVFFLTETDREGVRACYDRYLNRSNGLMERFESFWDGVFADPAKQIAGVKKGNQISAYLINKFEKGAQNHFLSNNLFIYEMIYDTPDDLLELLTFLHSQADQIEQIIFNTQDDSFHYLLQDPRNDSGKFLPGVLYHESSIQGLGTMYRIIDIVQLFNTLRDHKFGTNSSFRLKIDLSDSFLPENGGEKVIQFSEGQARLIDDKNYDVAVRMDVSEFSSMIIGAVGFLKLYEYGLTSISDATYVTEIDRLFAAPKPICLTSF